MKPSGLERVRSGRETLQSIRNQRAGKDRPARDRHVGEIGRDYESRSWGYSPGHSAWRAHKNLCSRGAAAEAPESREVDA
jgi:hypothetical protein